MWDKFQERSPNLRPERGTRGRLAMKSDLPNSARNPGEFAICICPLPKSLELFRFGALSEIEATLPVNEREDNQMEIAADDAKRQY
jgi:hypothetical protein